MRDEQEMKTLSLGALANALGITRYNAEQLEKNKVFTKVKRGQYVLADCVKAFIRLRVETEVRDGLEAAKRADEVSISYLGEVLGIGERWVQQLEAQGVLRKSARGRYPLATSVRAYTKFKVDSEVARAILKGNDAGRARQGRARAQTETRKRRKGAANRLHAGRSDRVGRDLWNDQGGVRRRSGSRDRRRCAPAPD